MKTNSSNLKLVGIIIAVLFVIVATVVFALQGVQNGAINISEQVKTALSDINVQEKRRADLIPNLVDCVKQYDKHEYETLMNVVNARGENLSDADIEEIKNSINFVVEQYPDLESSSNYKELMNELATTENLIANYRSSYNSFVQKYNSYVMKFPNRSILNFLGYEVIDYQRLNFEVSHDAPTNLFD